MCRFLGVDDSSPPDVVGQLFNPRTRDPNAPASEPRRRSTPRRIAGRVLHRDHATPAVQTRSSNGAIPSDVRQRLSDYFQPHNAALASEFGIDVSSWEILDLRTAGDPSDAPQPSV